MASAFHGCFPLPSGLFLRRNVPLIVGVENVILSPFVASEVDGLPNFLFDSRWHGIICVIALFNVLIAFGIGNSGGDEPAYEFIVRRMFKYEVLLNFRQKLVHSHRLLAAGRTRAGFHLENLHCFGENQLAVSALLCHKADHTVSSIQLLEFRK